MQNQRKMKSALLSLSLFGAAWVAGCSREQDGALIVPRGGPSGKSEELIGTKGSSIRPGSPITPGQKGPGENAPGTNAEAPPKGAELTFSDAFRCEPDQKSSSRPRVWRLDSIQYVNSVRSLFKESRVTVAEDLMTSMRTEESKFSNQSAYYGLPVLQLDRLLSAASLTSLQATPALLQRNRCLAAGDSIDPACAEGFVAEYGKRAFRRPLSPGEIETYSSALVKGSAGKKASESVARFIQRLLVAPDFLFRTELGDARGASGDLVPLTNYEIASALSYSLVNAPPDDLLMKAADLGELSSKENVAKHARRLLGVSSKSATVMKFMHEYLNFGEALFTEKEKKHFPEFSKNMPRASVMDTEAFLANILAKESKFLELLFTSRDGFASKDSARLYGLSLTSGTPTPVKLDEPERGGGILTQPSLLMAFSLKDSTDPIRRGKFISDTFLCRPIPPVQLEQVDPLPPLTADTTMRERLKIHLTKPSCKGCHSSLDNMGLALEGFDGVGVVRKLEAGRAVDVSGSISGTSEIDGPINGANEIAERLASSNLVKQCFTRQSFRYWMGRDETPDDGCSMRSIFMAYQDSNGNFSELVVAIFTSDSFLYRNASAGVEK